MRQPRQRRHTGSPRREPLVSTQVLVREADASIQPRVERYARNPGTGGRSVIQPTAWAAALAGGAVERTAAAATRWRADANGLPPTRWAGGFLLDGTQGSAHSAPPWAVCCRLLRRLKSRSRTCVDTNGVSRGTRPIPEEASPGSGDRKSAAAAGTMTLS